MKGVRNGCQDQQSHGRETQDKDRGEGCDQASCEASSQAHFEDHFEGHSDVRYEGSNCDVRYEGQDAASQDAACQDDACRSEGASIGHHSESCSEEDCTSEGNIIESVHLKGVSGEDITLKGVGREV